MSESTTPADRRIECRRRRHDAWVGTPRPRRRAGLSIYSILLIMLLSVSVLSSIVVGIIGYVNGTEALRSIAYDRLVEIRENRSREVAQLFTTIENAVRLGAMNETSKQAARDVHRRVRRARAAAARCRGIRCTSTPTTATRSPPISPRRRARRSTARPSPLAAARRSTCSTTTSSRTRTGKTAIQNEDAGDGSAWSAAHAKYHDYYQEMTRAAGLRRRPDARHRGQRRLLRVQGRRPRHEPVRRTVPALEPLRGLHDGDGPQHRGRRRDRRLRGLQPEPRQLPPGGR